MIYITGCSVDFRRFDGFDDTGEPCSLYSDTLKRTNVYGRRNFGKSCDMFLFPFVHKEWFFKSDNILDIDVDKIKDVKVLNTFIDGKCVYSLE